MERAFGFGPFFNPFFFPRRFVPFFFFSPFFFSPFLFPFRDENEQRDLFYTHACREGDTMEKLAGMYNVPIPVLEAVNPHLQSPAALTPGACVYVPRMDKLYCQKMYMEQEHAVSPAYGQSPQAAPYFAKPEGADYPPYGYPAMQPASQAGYGYPAMQPMSQADYGYPGMPPGSFADYGYPGTQPATVSGYGSPGQPNQPYPGL
ncbi:LysM peptidoglycan-binding domain-containing protein [Paenibacillus sp. GYB003]|uniref:LysM peptidoglycan-binding domain-containing protein n=1 Tax=Paenibacillus sp. GYB003 TaxID=2994392 RepID=UPI002F96BDF8